jgi:hypothetical protein
VIREKDYIIVISRHPYDIAGASTDRAWKSCMTLPDPKKKIPSGVYNHTLKLDVEYGSLIAYLTHPDDENIEKPQGRLLIKPYLHEDKNTVAYRVEPKVYGSAPHTFRSTVEEWVRNNYPILESGKYQLIDSEIYSDYGKKPVNLFKNVDFGNIRNILKQRNIPLAMLEYLKKDNYTALVIENSNFDKLKLQYEAEQMQPNGTLGKVAFIDSQVKKSNLFYSLWRNSTITDCVIRDTDAYKCVIDISRMEYCNMSECKINKSLWMRGTLQDSDFSNGEWEYGEFNGGLFNNNIWTVGGWYNGVFKDSEWNSGTWYNGTWENGTWFDGKWFKGTWKSGSWYDGTWHDGIWYDGVWEKGLWTKGIWKGGTWQNGAIASHKYDIIIEGCTVNPAEFYKEEKKSKTLEELKEKVAGGVRVSGFYDLPLFFLVQIKYENSEYIPSILSDYVKGISYRSAHKDYFHNRHNEMTEITLDKVKEFLNEDADKYNNQIFAWVNQTLRNKFLNPTSLEYKKMSKKDFESINPEDIHFYTFTKFVDPLFNYTISDGNYVNNTNDIESLKGLPDKIDGELYINGTYIQSLEGAPKQVGKLTLQGCRLLGSLEGMPKKVNTISIFSTSIGNLKGCPDKIEGDLTLGNSKLLKSLEGAPNHVGGKMLLSELEGLTSFEGAPEKVEGSFAVHKCTNIKSLKGFPKEIGDKLVLMYMGFDVTKEEILHLCKVDPEKINIHQGRK